MDQGSWTSCTRGCKPQPHTLPQVYPTSTCHPPTSLLPHPVPPGPSFLTLSPQVPPSSSCSPRSLHPHPVTPRSFHLHKDPPRSFILCLSPLAMFPLPLHNPESRSPLASMLLTLRVFCSAKEQHLGATSIALQGRFCPPPPKVAFGPYPLTRPLGE